MIQLLRWAMFVAVGTMLACADPAFALVIASDDASATAYNDGWQTGDNGGTGFGAWTVTTGTNATAFIGNSDVATSNKSWGVNSNSTTNAAAGVRTFNSALIPGWVFSIDMDNGNISSGTVGFSLRNAAGASLAEYFLAGSGPNYTLNATSVSGTTPSMTLGGMHLTFRLTDANSFIMTVDKLSTGIGVDNTLTGDLLANADQTITNVRVFTLNTGNGSSKDSFFNNISITAVPEASSIAFGCLVCSLIGLSYGVRKLRRRRLVGTNQDLPAFCST